MTGRPARKTNKKSKTRRTPGRKFTCDLDELLITLVEAYQSETNDDATDCPEHGGQKQDSIVAPGRNKMQAGTAKTKIPWQAIARVMTSKTAALRPQAAPLIGKQCRERYLNYLDPSIDHSPLTVEDEKNLIKLHKKCEGRFAQIAREFPRNAEGKRRAELFLKNNFSGTERRKQNGTSKSTQKYKGTKAQQRSDKTKASRDITPEFSFVVEDQQESKEDIINDSVFGVISGTSAADADDHIIDFDLDHFENGCSSSSSESLDAGHEGYDIFSPGSKTVSVSEPPDDDADASGSSCGNLSPSRGLDSLPVHPADLGAVADVNMILSQGTQVPNLDLALIEDIPRSLLSNEYDSICFWGKVDETAHVGSAAAYAVPRLPPMFPAWRSSRETKVVEECEAQVQEPSSGFFIQWSGLVPIASTMLSMGSSEADVAKKLISVLDECCERVQQKRQFLDWEGEIIVIACPRPATEVLSGLMVVAKSSDNVTAWQVGSEIYEAIVNYTT